MSAPAVVTMRKLCSWCGSLIQAGHEPVSHGICSGCLAEQRQKMKVSRRVPPLIVCPYCHPGIVSYAGVVVSRVCSECKAELAEAELPHAPAGTAGGLT